jgi:hypothetical protein
MIRVLTILTAVVALATAAPGYAVNDGTSNTRLVAVTSVRLPTTPATPPGVPIPYPNVAGPSK